MELYHVLNRGVEKRDIFMDDSDRFRFVHALGLFNTATAANNTTYLVGNTHNDFVNRYADPIVDVHGWCLMRNHYHLLLSEKMEGGLTKFIRKLNVGYANYFNARHEHEGSLFQGRTKKVLIASDAHFLHILTYIHLNPLDFLSGAKEWRQRTIKRAKYAREHLEAYRWSSYNDYCGRANFPSIVTTDVFERDPKKFEKETLAYLQDIDRKTPNEYRLE